MNAFLCLSLVSFCVALQKGGGKCASELDCSLGGACIEGRCECDPMWTAANCSVVDLLPTSLNFGYRNASGESSWGGNAIYRDGLWHMYVSQISDHLDLRQWGHRSFIAHCVSLYPQGPYEFVQRALEGYGHNPTVREAPDGTLLLYYVTQAHSDVSLATASSPYGPWTSRRGILVAGHRITNPSPHIFANGTVALFYRFGGFRSLRFGLALADHWSGQYYRVRQPILREQGEDPFVWLDQRGHWHMLFHGCKDPYHGGKDGWCFTVGNLREQADYCGRTAYSRDLLHWIFSWPVAYTSAVALETSSVAFLRRERPQLLFVNNTPAFLVTGVMRGVTGRRTYGYSFTLIQPVRQ